jgi:hypothetical protein
VAPQADFRVVPNKARWYFLGALVVALGLIGTSGKVNAALDRSSRTVLNPNVCPSPSLVGSAIGIRLLQVESSHRTIQQTGAYNYTSCSYRASPSAVIKGQSVWVPIVQFFQPISKAYFDRQIRQAKSLSPPQKVTGLGTEAYVSKIGVLILNGDTMLDLFVPVGTLKVNTTGQEMIGLAKKLL